MNIQQLYIYGKKSGGNEPAIYYSAITARTASITSSALGLAK